MSQRQAAHDPHPKEQSPYNTVSPDFVLNISRSYQLLYYKLKTKIRKIYDDYVCIYLTLRAKSEKEGKGIKRECKETRKWQEGEINTTYSYIHVHTYTHKKREKKNSTPRIRASQLAHNLITSNSVLK